MVTVGCVAARLRMLLGASPHTSVSRRSLWAWGRGEAARLQHPAASECGRRVMTQRVVVARQAVARPNVQLPPRAAAAAAGGRPGRIVAQEAAADQRLGVRVPAAGAAGGHLRLHLQVEETSEQSKGRYQEWYIAAKMLVAYPSKKAALAIGDDWSL